MPSIVVLNDKGNQVTFNVKQILTIDGVPYVSSNQDLRDAVITLTAKVEQIERMLVMGQPEYQPTGD